MERLLVFCLGSGKEETLIFTKVNEPDYTRYLNILAVIYAFILPLSRAGISLLTVLLIVVWLLEGRLKEKFSYLLSNNVIKIIFIFLIFNIISLFWTD
ncbi:hypothetical protein C9925_02260, partial [cyanobacterium G8-9]